MRRRRDAAISALSVGPGRSRAGTHLGFGRSMNLPNWASFVAVAALSSTGCYRYSPSYGYGYYVARPHPVTIVAGSAVSVARIAHEEARRHRAEARARAAQEAAA